VTGDRELRSDHPLVRRLNPRVDEISLWFEEPGAPAPAVAGTTAGTIVSGALRRLPAEGGRPEDFVPEHWRVFSHAEGDLNGDGLADRAMSVTPDENDPANEAASGADDYFPPPDIVVVLFAGADGRLRRVATNSRLSPRSGEARPHRMEIANGVLTLNANFGDDQATDVTYRFRYDRAAGKLLLAGYDHETYSRPGVDDALRTSEDYVAGVRVEQVRYGTRTKEREGARPDPPPKRTRIAPVKVPFEAVSYDEEHERPFGRPFKEP